MAPGANQTAWPSQPPSRSGSGGGRGGYRVPGRSGGRRWLRPRRILAILAGLVALIVVVAVAVYFSVNSKLTKADVLTPVVVHLGRDELGDHRAPTAGPG